MTTKTKPSITRDPEIHSGTPVFAGTRIAVRILLDYLAEGQGVDDFLRHYPTVTRAQAIAAIEELERLLEAQA
jgi:uncharacterized protein (DUF433 family)